MNTRGLNNSSFTQPGENFHFRLCHFCLNLNESSTVVHRCDRCGRTLSNPHSAQALYRQVVEQLSEEVDGLAGLEEGMDEDEEALEEMESTISEALPINGLSVVW